MARGGVEVKLGMGSVVVVNFIRTQKCESCKYQAHTSVLSQLTSHINTSIDRPHLNHAPGVYM